MKHKQRPSERGAAPQRLQSITPHMPAENPHSELTDEQIAMAASDEEVAYALFGSHVRQRLLELITLRGQER